MDRSNNSCLSIVLVIGTHKRLKKLVIMKDKYIALYELEKHKIKYKDNKEDEALEQ